MYKRPKTGLANLLKGACLYTSKKFFRVSMGILKGQYKILEASTIITNFCIIIINVYYYYIINV